MAILATLCYVKRPGQTLMLHRTKKVNDIHQGKWNGLGGKFEPGETPEDCVIREIREEAGLSLRRPELRGLLTFPEFKDGVDWYVFLFVARDFSGDIHDCPEGHLQWIPDEQLLDLNLWAGDRIFLPWLQQHRFFSASFRYRDGALIEHTVTFHPAS